MTAASADRLTSLSAGTILDATPEQALRAAAAAGFGGFGIRWEPDSTSPRGLRGLRRAIAASGLRLLDLEVVRLAPDVPVGTHRPWVDVAGELGAHFVLVVSDHPDISRSRDELVILAEWCAPAGLTVALEFMRFTAVSTFAAASGLVSSTGAANLAVLVDALHLQRGGETPGALVGSGHAPVGYVQLCDASAAAPEGSADPAVLAHEARHDRLFPGDGELPLIDLVTTLPPDLPCCVEVQSDRWSALDVVERAQRAMLSLREVLTAVERRRDARSSPTPRR